MRTVVRDRQDVYVSLRLPAIPIVNDSGYAEGEYIPYDIPQKITVRVSELNDESEIALFGAKSATMKKIVESTVCLPPENIDYLSAVWIGKVPSASAYVPITDESLTVIPEELDYNYRVVRAPIVTPRQIVVYLESVVDNAS